MDATWCRGWWRPDTAFARWCEILPALTRRLAEHPDDNINVVWALEDAIRKLEDLQSV